MATETQTGMDRAEMKRFLIKSKQEPVNCALGVGDDKSVALLMLARNRSPKALQGDLQKEFPSAFNTRFGTAVVDIDDDPTLVKFGTEQSGHQHGAPAGEDAEGHRLSQGADRAGGRLAG